jgi:hypothetical protein
MQMRTVVNRVIQPAIANFPLFALSWSLMAVIGVVAADPTCRSLSLGKAEWIVSMALGLPLKTALFWLMAFYLLATMALSLSGKAGQAYEIQEKFLRPVAVPLLFQVAGLFAGVVLLRPEHGGTFMALAIAVCTVVFALAVHNAAYLFTPKAPDA